MHVLLTACWAHSDVDRMVKPVARPRLLGAEARV